MTATRKYNNTHQLNAASNRRVLTRASNHSNPIYSSCNVIPFSWLLV